MTPHRSSRRMRAAYLLLVVVLVAYTATTIPGVRSTAGYNTLIDGWLQNGILVAASVIICLRALAERTARVGWLLIGIGVGLYALGNILYFAHVQYLHPVPYPSEADVPWLASYVFLFAGLIGVIRRRVSIPDSTLVLDIVVATLGLSALASTWLAYVLRVTDGRLTAVAVTMAYPVCDMVLVTLLVATCALLGWRADRSLTYLGIGFFLFAAADTIYTLRVATGTYQAGTWLDPIWAVAAVVMAAAALRRPSLTPALPRTSWWALTLPMLFTGSSLALLMYGGVRHVPIVATVLAGAALLAGIWRAALTFRDVQRLAVTRTEARTDDLTGLANRRRFMEVGREQIANCGPGERLAVLLLDLDRFKEVNDALGHSIGDALLVEVGLRLATHMRPDDVLARLGGDEFAILLGRVSAGDALQTAERLRHDLQQEFIVDEMNIQIDASVGVAVYPEVATTIDGLLQRADIAMYEAKVDRLGTVVYEPGDDDDLTARLRLIQDLRRAISEGQLVLHYQPKYRLDSGEVIGVEALVRWAHPTRGLLYPDAFLQEAERCGYMRRLTTAVLALALDQAKAWRDAGLQLPVAVNVSTSNLLDAELPDQIADLLAVRGLTASALEIEVTETTLMVDPVRSMTTLEGLHALGVHVSIDDYGTGHSSLARLRDLPVHELKLDRAFIVDIGSDRRSAAIVESTVRLAHSLDLVMVAEGIEDEESERWLRDLGCDFGQGYLFSRPVPADQITELIGCRVPVPRSGVGH